MYGTSGGEIPSVGKVDMSWIQTPLPPVSLPAKTALSKIVHDEDAKMEEVDSHGAVSSPAHNNGGSGGNEQEVNLDYDVADDDWIQ